MFITKSSAWLLLMAPLGLICWAHEHQLRGGVKLVKRDYHGSSFPVLSKLPSGLLRMQKESQGDRVCNGTELGARLATLVQAKADCAGIRDLFSDAFRSSSFEDQTKALDGVCHGTCGADFDKTVSEWRSWCSSEDATFDIVPDDSSDKEESVDAATGDGLGYAMSLFGCSKASTDGEYCGAVFAAPETDEADGCPFLTSCCFSELLDIEPDLVAEDAETSCPGALKASQSLCSA